MECPKCHFDHPQQFTECLKCGIVFAKYRAIQEGAAAAAPAPVPKPKSGPLPDYVVEEQQKAHHELLCRIFAVPGALLFGWLVNYGMPTVSAFLAMWLHESGHAIAAWFCGFTAFPTAWFTIVSDDRSRWISVLLGAIAIGGGYVAYRFERWFWVAISGVALVLLIVGNLQSDFHSRMLFTFWGDGGAYVLSTFLMMTFYARAGSPVRRNQVRWGLLIIGAIAFWSVYSRWSGGFENIANFLEDTDERGPSDIMQLTTMYGWSIYTLIHRYWQLGHACLVALAGVYAAGIVQAQRSKASLLSDLAGE